MAQLDRTIPKTSTNRPTTRCFAFMFSSYNLLLLNIDIHLQFLKNKNISTIQDFTYISSLATNVIWDVVIIINKGLRKQNTINLYFASDIPLKNY